MYPVCLELHNAVGAAEGRESGGGIRQVEDLGIAVVGLVLALEPSNERIQGDFLKTVLWRAAPGGIAAACCGAISTGMVSAGWPRELCSTLATLSTGTVCYFVLVRTCLPLTRTRFLLLVAVGALFAGAFLSKSR